MKTKIIISFLLSLHFVTVGYGQPNYYPNNNGIIEEEGYTYQYRMEDEMYICLFNAPNKWIDTKWQLADGSDVSMDMFMGKVPTIHKASHPLRDIRSKVNSCFSQEEKEMLTGEIFRLTIDLRIDPQSGKIDDVAFLFPNDSQYTHIPVQTYQKIESNLKSFLSFSITPEGKKLKYVMAIWSQYIK